MKYIKKHKDLIIAVICSTIICAYFGYELGKTRYYFESCQTANAGYEMLIKEANTAKYAMEDKLNMCMDELGYTKE